MIFQHQYYWRVLLLPQKNKNDKGFRPTSSFLIQVLNNLLDFNDKCVLDLFAGSGRVGKLALSNNAKTVFFVESNFKLISEIKKALSENSQCIILCMDAFKFLSRKEYSKFSPADIIFADPPFEKESGDEILAAIDNSFWKASYTLFILQQFHKTRIPNHSNWEIIEKRRYGEQNLLFFRPKEFK